MDAAPGANPYAVPLSELEDAAHVPVDEQVAAQAKPPPPDVVSPEERERQRLLRTAADGA